MNSLKYLTAYIIPLTGWISISGNGLTSFTTVIVAFGLLPILDQMLPKRTENFSKEEEKELLSKKFYDVLLWINIPIVAFLLWLYFNGLYTESWSSTKVIGATLAMGIVLSTCGINVAHELGHKSNIWSQRASKLLLLPCLYQHFFIEHNRGHHKMVSTPEDPASSRRDELLYTFVIRSSTMGYLNAWKLERDRLKKSKLQFWSIHNEMLIFTFITLCYLALVAIIFDPRVMIFAIIVGVIAFLLLEAINYVEHYGLSRRKLKNGRYEPVTMLHSWNSNHELGRIMLYELTRHADHHAKSARKYQVLRHYDDSPQLPLGYPGSILMAAIPPLWFYFMNPRLDKIQTS